MISEIYNSCSVLNLTKPRLLYKRTSCKEWVSFQPSKHAFHCNIPICLSLALHRAKTGCGWKAVGDLAATMRSVYSFAKAGLWAEMLQVWFWLYHVGHEKGKCWHPHPCRKETISKQIRLTVSIRASSTTFQALYWVSGGQLQETCMVLITIAFSAPSTCSWYECDLTKCNVKKA